MEGGFEFSHQRYVARARRKRTSHHHEPHAARPERQGVEGAADAAPDQIADDRIADRLRYGHGDSNARRTGNRMNGERGPPSPASRAPHERDLARPA